MGQYERRARELVYERSNRICEICSAARAHSAHHRLRVSQGGLWAATNLIHLCGHGTSGCHGMVHSGPRLGQLSGWLVKRGGYPATIPVYLTGPDGARYVWLGEDGSLRDAVTTSPLIADLLTARTAYLEGNA